MYVSKSIIAIALINSFRMWVIIILFIFDSQHIYKYVVCDPVQKLTRKCLCLGMTVYIKLYVNTLILIRCMDMSICSANTCHTDYTQSI